MEIGNGPLPLLTAAIHNGHNLSPGNLEYTALDEETRLREEDPFTGIWTSISDKRIIANYSRFQVDLNRPREKAVYIKPEDAWGLTVWNSPPPPPILAAALEQYDRFYRDLYSVIKGLMETFGRLIIFDLHSYNHRRKGPDQEPDDPVENPGINIGTGTMDRTYWAPVIDRLIQDLRNHDFPEGRLDVRENIKFKGGFFPRWIHTEFTQKVCCVSLEFKKWFMDEWTGCPDEEKIKRVGEMLNSVIPAVLERLARM